MNVESNWVLFPTPSPKLNRVKEGGGGGGVVHQPNCPLQYTRTFIEPVSRKSVFIG